MGKATIDDVAQLAGVSIKTVSRVANKEPNVRPSTREKVERAMAQLNYRPNLSARSLAGKRSYVLGLVYDNPSANYVIDVQNGVLSACRERGYDLLIHPCDHTDPDLLSEVGDLIRQTRVDGLILIPPLSDMPALTALLDDAQLPFVRIAPAVAKECSAYVETNDQQAAYLMTQQLLALGHRRIGFVCGHPDHRAVAYRQAGYHQALAEVGIAPDPALQVQGYNSFESGEDCARQLLEHSQRPTAIFASNDDMAAGVMQVAHRLGLSIPGDLSVVGFDDTPVAHQIWPSLTTVRQPIQAMARVATELLLQQLKQPGTERASRVLECSIILRDSIGPVPASR